MVKYLKRLLVILIGISLVFTFSVVGCKEKVVEEPAEEVVEEAEPAEEDPLAIYKEANIDWRQFEGTTLNVLCLPESFPWTGVMASELNPLFTELTGIEVNLDQLQEELFFKKAATSLSAGKGEYDVTFVGIMQFAQYTEGGWLEPLDGYFNNPKLCDLDWYEIEDFIPAALIAGNRDGNQYTVPFAAMAEILYCNKDVFDEKGVELPKTYDELYDVCMQLHNPPDFDGFVTRGMRGVSIISEWTGVFLSYGADYFDETGKCTVNSPAGVEATDMFVKLMYDCGPGDAALGFTWMEASEHFEQGRAAVYMEVSAQGPVVEGPQSLVAGKVEYIPLPTYKDINVSPSYWFWMLGIPSAGKNLEAAFLYLTFASSKVAAPPLSEGGVAPSRTSEWQPGAYTSKYPGNYQKATLDSISMVEPERTPYYYPEWPEIADIVSAEIINVMTGVKDSQTAMDDAAAAVDKLILGQ
ncbi:hypothetical protein ES705_00011 [subsurface metagenome]|nr:extracellular solute-binding protein [Clostridia bacterium]